MSEAKSKKTNKKKGCKRMADSQKATGVSRARRTGLRHFAQSNPTGDGEGDVAALLRRVADSIDELGDIQVQDIVLRYTLTGGEDDLVMVVYYYDEPRRR